MQKKIFMKKKGNLFLQHKESIFERKEILLMKCPPLIGGRFF